MLISTVELRSYLQTMPLKVKMVTPEFLGDEETFNTVINLILQDVTLWEKRNLEELGHPPSGLGVDKEQALVVYCGPKLYEFVEKFSVDEADFNMLTLGKIYLEVKKAIKDGKFKRV